MPVVKIADLTPCPTCRALVWAVDLQTHIKAAHPEPAKTARKSTAKKGA